MTALSINPEERLALLRTFAPFADCIEEVRLFGSRATGHASPGSDIDLALFGDIDALVERRLWTDLDESSLPVAVDLVVYNRIDSTLLKQHIDAVSVPLFNRSDLAAANDLAAS